MNIPVRGGHGNVEEGSAALPYLPPVPPKGTGFHRYVFSLYTHTVPLPQRLPHATPLPGDPPLSNNPLSGGPETDARWLEQRGFSSAEFVCTHQESGLKPWSFAFFQCQWDKSVSHTYKHTLSKSYLSSIYKHSLHSQSQCPHSESVC